MKKDNKALFAFIIGSWASGCAIYAYSILNLYLYVFGCALGVIAVMYGAMRIRKMKRGDMK